MEVREYIWSQCSVGIDARRTDDAKKKSPAEHVPAGE